MGNNDRTKVIPNRTPESAAMSASVKRAMAIIADLNRLTFSDAAVELKRLPPMNKQKKGDE